MESTNNDNVAVESPQEITYTWLCITTSAGKFIVKTAVTKKAILRKQECGESLVVEELYDYGCPIQEVPTGPKPGDIGIGKMHFSSRMDSTLYPCKAYISLAGSMLYFLEDLRESDGEQYKAFIQTAYNSSIAAAKQRAARNSGIITASELPKGGVLGKSRF